MACGENTSKPEQKEDSPPLKTLQITISAEGLAKSYSLTSQKSDLELFKLNILEEKDAGDLSKALLSGDFFKLVGSSVYLSQEGTSKIQLEIYKSGKKEIKKELEISYGDQKKKFELLFKYAFSWDFKVVKTQIEQGQEIKIATVEATENNKKISAQKITLKSKNKDFFKYHQGSIFFKKDKFSQLKRTQEFEFIFSYGKIEKKVKIKLSKKEKRKESNDNDKNKDKDKDNNDSDFSATIIKKTLSEIEKETKDLVVATLSVNNGNLSNIKIISSNKLYQIKDDKIIRQKAGEINFGSKKEIKEKVVFTFFKDGRQSLTIKKEFTYKKKEEVVPTPKKDNGTGGDDSKESVKVTLINSDGIYYISSSEATDIKIATTDQKEFSLKIDGLIGLTDILYKKDKSIFATMDKIKNVLDKKIVFSIGGQDKKYTVEFKEKKTNLLTHDDRPLGTEYKISFSEIGRFFIKSDSSLEKLKIDAFTFDKSEKNRLETNKNACAARFNDMNGFIEYFEEHLQFLPYKEEKDKKTWVLTLKPHENPRCNLSAWSELIKKYPLLEKIEFKAQSQKYTLVFTSGDQHFTNPKITYEKGPHWSADNFEKFTTELERQLETAIGSETDESVKEILRSGLYPQVLKNWVTTNSSSAFSFFVIKEEDDKRVKEEIVLPLLPEDFEESLELQGLSEIKVMVNNSEQIDSVLTYLKSKKELSLLPHFRVIFDLNGQAFETLNGLDFPAYGSYKFESGKIKKVENLTLGQGKYDFSNLKITAVEDITFSSGDYIFEHNQINSLAGCTFGDGDHNFFGSQIEELIDIKFGDGNFVFAGSSKLKELKDLKFGAGDYNFASSALTTLENITFGSGDYNFNFNNLDLSKIKGIDFSYEGIQGEVLIDGASFEHIFNGHKTINP